MILVGTAGSNDFTQIRYLEGIDIGCLTTTSDVRVAIKDTDTNGTTWFSYAVPAGMSFARSFPHPVLITGGVYVSVVDGVTGTATASIARVSVTGT